ncbi:Protein CBG09215 [Caenorhabditis briggsae]|uniref:Protein CBG09215 n=1 Tax=Caenorhabditis briggsae TaxID=6238 RepID=A8X8B9_CAEBR|nr:Protein CBG09215 [Caenorhabditis briggsae]CAP28880.1 Protein CBG09215 [Caenorhabditis briggsae]
MRLQSGQRTICIFLVLLATAVCLALFLDNPSSDKHFIILCFVVFATDASFFAVIFYSIYTDLRASAQQAMGLRALWCFLYPFNTVHTGQFICITCKVIFEVLLAVKLTFGISIPYCLFFITLWVFCGIIFYDLTRRLYSIQKKVSRR